MANAVAPKSGMARPSLSLSYRLVNDPSHRNSAATKRPHRAKIIGSIARNEENKARVAALFAVSALVENGKIVNSKMETDL